jgi:hypothetical protein
VREALALGKHNWEGLSRANVSMNYFFAAGAWGLWYVVLWASVLPFLVMLIWLFVHVSPRTAGEEENTVLNGSVLGAFFLLVLSSFVSVILFVRTRPSATVWTYVGWLALHFVGWTFLGSSIFFASLQALGGGRRLAMRRVAGAFAFAGALVAHAASLYAIWRVRTGR